MVRHEVKRIDRAKAEDDIIKLEEKMVTYEEKAEERNANFTWKKMKRMLWFPVPNKIREIEAVSPNPFSPRASAFFTKRVPGYPEPEDGESSQSSAISSEDEEERSSDDGGSTTNGGADAKESEWKMFECYTFCMKQLVWSRIWIIILQFIAAELAGERFRTDAFNLADRLIPHGQSLAGDIALRVFAGLRRWDAQHFLFISDNHYIFEHSLAFFPGFPEITNIIRMTIMYYISSRYGVLISPWIITSMLIVALNLFFFHVAGFCLFMITLMITRSVKRGLLAVSLLAYNPASIFFTAAYSESMYLALTLTAFSLTLFAVRSTSIISRVSGCLVGSMVFGLAFVVRSNGLLNLLFIAWMSCGSLLWEPETPIADCNSLIESISFTRNERYRRDGQARLRAFEKKRKQLRKVFRWTEPAFSNCAILFLGLLLAASTLFSFFFPYFFMTNSVAAEFCNAEPKQKELVAHLHRAIRIPPAFVTILDAHERSPWCKREKLFGLVPQYYSEIQAKYWEVGLFRYWQIRKIPCFLLMLPAAIITVLAIRDSFKDVFEKRRWFNIWVLTGRSDHTLPLALHAAVLLFTAVFYINAEVFTRLMFSSSPFLYIYLAGFLDERTQGNTPGNRLWHYEQSFSVFPFFVFRRVWNGSWQGKLLYIYFIGYFVFGTMAHAAWLPFT